MNHFIALSFEPDHGTGYRAQFAARAAESLETLCPSTAAVLADSDDLTVVGSSSLNSRLVQRRHGCFMLNLSHSVTDVTRRRRLDSGGDRRRGLLG